jgi:hypothetical protein
MLLTQPTEQDDYTSEVPELWDAISHIRFDTHLRDWTTAVKLEDSFSLSRKFGTKGLLQLFLEWIFLLKIEWARSLNHI